KAQECIEHSPSVGAESHRTAYRDLARKRRRSREESFFPSLRNVDGEVPGVGSPWLVAAQLAIALIHGTIQGVPVDGRRAGVHPETGSVVEGSDDLIQQARTLNSRFIDGAPIGWVIPAIDAQSGQVDAHIALCEIGDPVAGRTAIPGNHAPRSGPRCAAEYRNRVSL